VVGHAGLARTLVIVVLANGITLVTVLALSAVATNSRVGVPLTFEVRSPASRPASAA
jgi:hypothetical protein